MVSDHLRVPATCSCMPHSALKGRFSNMVNIGVIGYGYWGPNLVQISQKG